MFLGMQSLYKQAVWVEKAHPLWYYYLLEVTMKYSVIIPMYNEQEVMAESVRRLQAVMQTLPEADDYELIFVNDGSRDATMEIMRPLAKADGHIRIIDFARNFGHQTAVTAGMAHASGESIAIIDADLQDPPELLPDMFKKLAEGYDVVYGTRKKRAGESFFKLFTAKLFYKLINRLTGNLVPMDTGDFRVLTNRALQVLNAMPEHNRFLRGMGSWIGFSQYSFLYERQERFAGVTKYPLKKMLRLAKDGIISFSNKPLEALSSAGVLVLALSLLWLLALLVLAVAGVPFGDWMLTTAFNALFTGILLVGMGVTGEYIGRMYDEAKGRPLYTVREFINFNKTGSK